MIGPLITVFNTVCNLFFSIFNVIAQMDIVEGIIKFFCKS